MLAQHIIKAYCPVKQNRREYLCSSFVEFKQRSREKELLYFNEKLLQILLNYPIIKLRSHILSGIQRHTLGQLIKNTMHELLKYHELKHGRNMHFCILFVAC